MLTFLFLAKYILFVGNAIGNQKHFPCVIKSQPPSVNEETDANLCLFEKGQDKYLLPFLLLIKDAGPALHGHLALPLHHISCHLLGGPPLCINFYLTFDH